MNATEQHTLPLVYKGKLAINGIAGDELSRPDGDLAGLFSREGAGVDAAHGHQAGEVGALPLHVHFALCVELVGGPAAHVACTVHSAVPLGFCGGRDISLDLIKDDSCS